MFTRLPLWRPTPEKLTGRLSVCWCSTGGLNKSAFSFASGEMIAGTACARLFLKSHDVTQNLLNEICQLGIICTASEINMLHVLHLEDCPEDSFFIQRALAHNGISAAFTVVASRAEFAAALKQHHFDLILADHALPGFSGLEALNTARRETPDIGFICVSGSANEDQMQATLNSGVTDYVIKDQLWQLVASVRREQERLRLVRLNKGQARLVAAVQELSLARDLDSIMEIVRRAARELTGADGATFVLKDGEFCYYADENAIAPLWKGQRFPLKTCISGWAMLNRRPAVIEDIYADSRIPADAYRPTFVKSLAMVPIRTEAPIGAIGNYWAAHHLPTTEEVELLQALANTTAVAMENVQVYTELEQRVKRRTAQLEAANTDLENANRELDAFSHAVSHDLGAPLRSIRGFADLVRKECGAALSDAGKDYLARIESSGKQMRGLIDDLLRLSKVGRMDLKKERIDLTALVKEIVAQLYAADEHRKVDIRIAEGVEAEVDRGLIRIVLENLLSNAWKYTSRIANAQIEFRTVAQPDGSTAFCIRDNGAGFDQANAEMLFQPFRRLHTQEEFPGSGIGLTTVQRIIHRHRGKIWAESEVNKGAAFYFTLGAAQSRDDLESRSNIQQ
jgi:signal transduction histidine kinase